MKSTHKKQKENRLIVGDATWADTIPEWLLEEVKHERMMYGLFTLLKPDMPKVGPAEIAVYLMTASLRAPLLTEHANIYIWCCAKVYARKNKEMTDDMKEMLERGLTKGEEYYHKELVYNIYRARGGEINHPLLDAMRSLKKRCDKIESKTETKQPVPIENSSAEVQGILFEK